MHNKRLVDVVYELWAAIIHKRGERVHMLSFTEFRILWNATEPKGNP